MAIDKWNQGVVVINFQMTWKKDNNSGTWTIVVHIATANKGFVAGKLWHLPPIPDRFYWLLKLGKVSENISRGRLNQPPPLNMLSREVGDVNKPTFFPCLPLSSVKVNLGCAPCKGDCKLIGKKDIKVKVIKRLKKAIMKKRKNKF